MATQTAKEKRKLNGEAGASGNGDRARTGSGPRSGDNKVLLVSHEITRLLEASRDGRLTERGRPDQFDGVYREMVEGINSMLDAILLPSAKATASSRKSPVGRSTN